MDDSKITFEKATGCSTILALVLSKYQANNTNMLKIQGVSKQFNHLQVLEGIDLELGDSESVAILGPSGCGKTTLLNLICGMEKPNAGTIHVNENPVVKPSTDIAFILQNYGLLPWKNNLENVALGLKIKGMPTEQRNRMAREQLRKLGLEGREKEYPAILSGGEQQRVAIARAYATSPNLLLMDEPFSSLDAITRENLQDTLVESWISSQLPYVLVTHSVEEAVYLGQKIIILAGKPARIQVEFNNPDFSSPNYRQTSRYYQLVRKIRKKLGEYK